MSFLKTPIDIIARIIRIVRSPMDFGTGYSWDQTLANLWRRIVAICFAVITCLTIRLHVMGWTTPGEVRAFSQFDNPLAHTEDRTSRVLTGWYLAARHMSLLFFPIQPLCHDWSLDSVRIHISSYALTHTLTHINFRSTGTTRQDIFGFS